MTTRSARPSHFPCRCRASPRRCDRCVRRSPNLDGADRSRSGSEGSRGGSLGGSGGHGGETPARDRGFNLRRSDGTPTLRPERSLTNTRSGVRRMTITWLAGSHKLVRPRSFLVIGHSGQGLHPDQARLPGRLGRADHDLSPAARGRGACLLWLPVRRTRRGARRLELQRHRRGTPRDECSKHAAGLIPSPRVT